MWENVREEKRRSYISKKKFPVRFLMLCITQFKNEKDDVLQFELISLIIDSIIE